MTPAPRISVIVAVKDRAATLARCLESVPDGVELLVADGGSTDGSAEILRHAAARLSWWCSEPDGGVYPAWNKALGHATGDWILFLGGDDWISSAADWVTIAARLDGLPHDVRVAYGPVRLVAASGREVAVVGEPWERAGPLFPRQMSIPHQGVFHRRDLFAAIGSFDESYRIAGDYELLLRELPAHPAAFLGADVVVASMTTGGLSLQGCNTLLHLREIRRAQERHGVFAFNPAYVARWLRAALRRTGDAVIGPRLAGRLADRVRNAGGRPPLWSVK